MLVYPGMWLYVLPLRVQGGGGKKISKAFEKQTKKHKLQGQTLQGWASIYLYASHNQH